MNMLHALKDVHGDPVVSIAALQLPMSPNSLVSTNCPKYMKAGELGVLNSPEIDNQDIRILHHCKIVSLIPRDAIAFCGAKLICAFREEGWCTLKYSQSRASGSSGIQKGTDSAVL